MTVNARYSQKSPRGPDGYSHSDLKFVPPELQQSLNRWEPEATFPQALLTGFVHPLPKRSDSTQAADFRPVIIYSMIYRSWSSLRARQQLARHRQVVGDHQFGFVPEREPAQIWMLLRFCGDLNSAGLSQCGLCHRRPKGL